MGQIKRKWKEFVIGLFQISIDAQSRNEFLIWSSNFTCMYNDYMLHNQNGPNKNSLVCTSFDKYLFSKIYPTMDWRRCNNHVNLMPSSEWCQAWRRIMKYNISVILTDFDKEKWSKPYLQDVKTLMQWLSSAVIVEKKIKADLVKLPFIPFQRPKRTGGMIDFSLCYLATIVMDLLLWKNHCREIFHESS